MQIRNKPTKGMVTISRILLGLIFVVFGLNGFLHFIPTSQYQGLAQPFIEAVFSSHFYNVVFGSQIVAGLLLLADRYVPFGLLLLGPVLVNILSFHISTAPRQIPLALVATAFWLIVFIRVRSLLWCVFSKGLPEEARPQLLAIELGSIAVRARQ